MSTFETVIGLTLTGIGIGSLYALVAIGFNLIYMITGVLNFAQGWIAMTGAYMVVILAGFTFINPYVAVALTLLLGVLFGLALERGIFRWFIGEPPFSVIIVTLALGMILAGLIRMIVGGETALSYPPEIIVDWSITVVGTTIPGPFILGVVLSLVTVLALVGFFRYTVVGSIMRASASDQQAAMALGISIERNVVFAWVISIFITTIGGILFAMSQGSVSFSIQHVGIIIFAAVILGGLDSIVGAFVGALAVGIMEQFGSYYASPVLGPGVGQVIPLAVMLVIILVLPYGLFGSERIERL